MESSIWWCSPENWVVQVSEFWPNMTQIHCPQWPLSIFKKLPQVRKLWNDEVLLPSMEYTPLAQVQDRFKVLALYGIHLSRILIWHKLVWNNLRVLLSKGWKEVINCHFHCIRWNHPSCWKPCGKIRSTKSWNPDKVYLPWPHQSWIITVNRLIFS